jgi:sodium/bile acid cotransporter 7
MAQILVYYFKWYLRRDEKSRSDDAEAGDEAQSVSRPEEGHESDATAHDGEDVERVPVERFEKKDVQSG